MLRIAEEKRLPLAVETPNGTTAGALAGLDAGKGERFGTVDELFRAPRI